MDISSFFIILILALIVTGILVVIASGKKQKEFTELNSTIYRNEKEIENTEEIKSIHPTAIAIKQREESLNAFLKESEDKSEREIQLTQIYLAQENLNKLEKIRNNSAILVNFQVFYLILAIITMVLVLVNNA